MCAVSFNLSQSWCSVSVLSLVLLMRKLGIENLGHLPEIPTVQPGFKPRLRGGACFVVLMIPPYSLCFIVPLLVHLQGGHTLAV